MLRQLVPDRSSHHRICVVKRDHVIGANICGRPMVCAFRKLAILKMTESRLPDENGTILFDAGPVPVRLLDKYYTC